LFKQNHVTITLAPEFGYLRPLCHLLGLRVGGAVEKLKSLPYMYAEKAAAEADKSKHVFNWLPAKRNQGAFAYLGLITLLVLAGRRR
ncbi:hypothetical protein BC829DRAFT_378844, partial [Chytridium lagenaria]